MFTVVNSRYHIFQKEFPVLTFKRSDNTSIKRLQVRGCAFRQKDQPDIFQIILERLNFDEHVSNLCKKGGRKLSVLARLSS